MTERLFPLTHNTSIFIVQAFISIATLSLMGYLLIDGRDPSNYLPVVTGVLAYWLPSPAANLKPTQPQNLIQSPQTTVAEGTNTYINPPTIPFQDIKVETPDLHQQIVNTVVHPQIVNEIHKIMKQDGSKITPEEISNTVVHPEVVDKINNLMITGKK